MTINQIRQFIQQGEWVSITTELRPSQNKTATGDINPFYCHRRFTYGPDDTFTLVFLNYADPFGKAPLVQIVIKGHLLFGDPHPIAEGAWNTDYVADLAYEITPLHPGFVSVVNKFPTNELNTWKAGVMQDVLGKSFPLFGLKADETYVDYDLIYVYDTLLFNGSKNVDGRAFDKPENRPTNLQVPLVRRA